jgi:DNA repair protein RecO (recombination protein O)
MALQKTEAIVLRSRHLGETSKILTLFTERYGKMATVAKGARRPKSRFGASLDLFAHSSVVLYLKENRDLHLVTESTLLEDFYGLREDAERLGRASAVVELVDRMVMRSERIPGLFSLLLGGFRAFQEQTRTSLLLSAVMLKIVSLLGFRPQLYSCSRCGRPVAGQLKGFSSSTGGVICRRCDTAENVHVIITEETLDLLQHLLSDEFEVIGRLDPGPGDERRVAAIVEDFVAHCSEDHRPLSSLKFLDRLK